MNREDLKAAILEALTSGDRPSTRTLTRTLRTDQASMVKTDQASVWRALDELRAEGVVDLAPAERGDCPTCGTRTELKRRGWVLK